MDLTAELVKFSNGSTKKSIVIFSGEYKKHVYTKPIVYNYLLFILILLITLGLQPMLKKYTIAYIKRIIYN